MTGIQQPSINDWPPGTAGPPPVRRRRRALMVVVAVPVVIVAAIIGAVVIAGHPKGSLVLPARLLSLPKSADASARHLASELRTAQESGSGGKISGVVAGVYGDPGGAWVAVTGGGICGTCAAKSASTQRANLAASGYPDARSFPAGSQGGVMACGSRTSGGATLVRCTWVDDRTAGNVFFAGGTVTSLADAAAKTNQVRAATEH